MVMDTVKEDELLWLARCAIGCVKSVDFLPDLPFLMKENGFLETKAKYVGGLRYLLECESVDAMNKMLQEGKDDLSNWFEWVKPWHREFESTRPGRLCWLSVRGVPLHFWNEETFRKIAICWGDVMEIEDLTSQHCQTYIGRVCILIREQGWVNNSHSVCCEGGVTINVIEDNLEIIDYGPRYVNTLANSVSSKALEDENSVAESELVSKSESPGGVSLDGEREECTQRTAWDKALTLGIDEVSKSVDKDQHSEKPKECVPAGSTKSSPEKAALGEHAELQMSCVQISEGHSDRVGLSDDELALQLAINTCDVSDPVVGGLGPLAHQDTTKPLGDIEVHSEAVSKLASAVEGSLTNPPEKRTSVNLGKGHKRGQSTGEANQITTGKVRPDTMTARISLRLIKMMARSKAVRSGSMKQDAQPDLGL